MTQIYSSAHLLQFIYHETSIAKTRAIKKALHNNVDLKNEWNELQTGKQMLSEPACTAKPSVIEKILAYSKLLE